MADEQDLNSLNRFRKHSPKLALEQHGHCEVPAGCGGAILRWRNPFAARTVRMHLYAPGSEPPQIDGVAHERRFFDLAPGCHALTLRVAAKSLKFTVMCALSAEHDRDAVAAGEVVEPPLTYRTGGPGDWRYTAAEPADDAWRLPGFDDSSWKKLVASKAGAPANGAEGAYEYATCEQAGAAPLGPQELPGFNTVYSVRFEFDVPTPTVVPEAAS